MNEPEEDIGQYENYDEDIDYADYMTFGGLKTDAETDQTLQSLVSKFYDKTLVENLKANTPFINFYTYKPLPANGPLTDLKPGQIVEVDADYEGDDEDYFGPISIPTKAATLPEPPKEKAIPKVVEAPRGRKFRFEE